MTKIHHAEVRVILDRNAEPPPDVVLEHKTVDWAEGLHKQAMLIVAAGVRAQQGSLDKAASVLWWAGFDVPAGYFPEGHEGADLMPGDEEALRSWVEREAERIGEVDQTIGFYLAASGKLMEEIPPPDAGPDGERH